MAKKSKKNKLVYTKENHENWLRVKKQVLKSPYFWISVIFGAAFLAVTLAAIVEASIRYQGFYEAGNAFNKAWSVAH